MDTALDSATLQELRLSMLAQDRAIAIIRDVQNEHAMKLAEGGRLMRQIEANVATLSANTAVLSENMAPITAAVTMMEDGINVLGKIGRCGVWMGEKGIQLGKFLVVAGALWVVGKLLWTGHPTQAWAELLRMFGK